MVTFEEIWEALGNRPFRPFRIVLKDGQTMAITRIAQAAASKPRQEMMVGVDGRITWVKLDRIDHLEYEVTQVT